jgi:hypothetical protein
LKEGAITTDKIREACGVTKSKEIVFRLNTRDATLIVISEE